MWVPSLVFSNPSDLARCQVSPRDNCTALPLRFGDFVRSVQCRWASGRCPTGQRGLLDTRARNSHPLKAESPIQFPEMYNLKYGKQQTNPETSC